MELKGKRREKSEAELKEDQGRSFDNGIARL